MKPQLSDLSWGGSIGRLNFLFWGCILFAVKYNLDRFVFLYHNQPSRPWRYPYAGPLPDITRFDQTKLFLSLLLVALPFILAGVNLTLKRIKSLDRSPWLVAFFFVPYVNMIFFTILAVLPGTSERANMSRNKLDSLLGPYIPPGRWGSIALGFLVTVTLGLGMGLVIIYLFKVYGLTLFIGIPFMGALISTRIHTYHQWRSWKDCVLVSLGSMAMLGLAFLVLAIEGIICMVMASPLMAGLAFLGGLVGYNLQEHKESLPAYFSAILFLPFLAFMEEAPKPPLLEVTSSVFVAAEPEVVWDHLIAFSRIPEPEELLFRLGIAYPTHATIEGQGPGAMRYCTFSTGSFVEPIEIWDKPHRLAFSVSEQPEPMRELSPYGQIDALHLDGYFGSERGQFLLESDGAGNTLLIGTTWYRQDLWPNNYWRPWSDWIIHKIHIRVLEHIRNETESAAGVGEGEINGTR